MALIKIIFAAVVLTSFFSISWAQNQPKPVPTDVWFQSMYPLMTEDFCKPESPFRREYRGKATECQVMVAVWMNHCYMDVLRQRFPATLNTQQEGVKAGEILGLCVYQSQQKENSITASTPKS